MKRSITDAELRKAARDIAAVRSAIRRNMSIMREIGVPPTLALSGLLFGIGITVLLPAMHLLIGRFGTHDAIPLWIRVLWYASAVVLAVSAAVSKQIGLYRSAKAIDRSYSQWTIAKEFIFTPSILGMILTVFGVLAAVSAYLASVAQPYFIIPAIGILFGILMVFFGGSTSVIEYHILGYWFAAAGIAVLFFRLPPLIAIAAVFGIGFLLFAAAGMITGDDSTGPSPMPRRREHR